MLNRSKSPVLRAITGPAMREQSPAGSLDRRGTARAAPGSARDCRAAARDIANQPELAVGGARRQAGSQTAAGRGRPSAGNTISAIANSCPAKAMRPRAGKRDRPRNRASKRGDRKRRFELEMAGDRCSEGSPRQCAAQSAYSDCGRARRARSPGSGCRHWSTRRGCGRAEIAKVERGVAAGVAGQQIEAAVARPFDQRQHRARGRSPRSTCRR